MRTFFHIVLSCFCFLFCAIEFNMLISYYFPIDTLVTYIVIFLTGNFIIDII